MVVETILYAADAERGRRLADVLRAEGYRCELGIVEEVLTIGPHVPIAFVDLALGSAVAIDLVRRLRASGAVLPRLIALVGEPDDAAVDALIAAGANMYFSDDARILGLRIRFLQGALQRRNEATKLVAQLRAAEEQNRILEREHLAHLDALDQIVGIFRDGKFLWANRKCAELTGRDAATLVGMPTIEIVDVSDHEAVLERRRTIAQGQSPAPREYHLVAADGSKVPILMVSMPTIFRGEPAHIGFARDLTEQRRLENELAAADRLASLGRLAASVGHEINNPLAYVIGNLDLALARSSDASMRKMLSEALAGAERIARIAADLNVFARRHHDLADTADVTEVIGSCLRMVATEVRHRARVVTAIDDVGHARIGPARLAQVVTNLLVNAAQAIPDAATSATITVRARRDDAAIVVSVEDTGVGIAADDLPRVLEPFYSTKRHGGGLGLGLSICHTLVTSHGGELTVTSEVGRGTCITIRLPRAEHATPAIVESRVSAQRWRILVIDDEPVLAQVLCDQLSPHSVTIATSGREALAQVADRAFDAIVCDLMMPDVGGIDVYEHLRAAHPGLEDKIVFVTGGAFTDRATSFLARVPNRCVEKPFKIDALVAAIADVASR